MPRAILSALVTSAVLATGCAALSPDELADAYRPPELDNLGLIEPPAAGTVADDESAGGSDTSSTGAETADPPPSRGSTEGRPPRAEPLVSDPAECWFDTGGYDVECGWIHIPSESAGVDAVRLSFARFKTSAPDAPTDPVVYLHGGPGGAVLEYADRLAPSIVDPFIATRDVVVYDQRGAGESSPLPVCREAWGLDLRFFSSDETHDAIEDAYVNSLSRCAERVERRRDIDLSEYNSAVNADDLLDLIRALGFDSVNLYGNSYGTRLAQTMLRDHPQVVRSVILSGVYPLEENLIGAVPETFRAALSRVFAACTDDPTCGRYLPDPWVTLANLVEQLDETPADVTVSTGDVASFPLEIAGDDLINLLHGLLYTADGAALIPDLLIDLEHGHTSRLRRVGPDAIYDTATVLGFMTVECREEVPFTTADEAAEATRIDTPWHRISLAPGLIGGVLLDACPLFPSIGEADPIEDEAVVWNQPTLILSGGFDPITPPWWAESVAARLPHATLAAFADRGHDADEGFCAAGLMARFIAAPEADLDISCANDNTTLSLTNTPEILVSPLDVSLRGSTFDIDPGAGLNEVGLLVPDWEVDRYLTEEAYWRSLDQWDSTVVVIRAGRWEPDEVTWYLDQESPAGFVATPSPANVSNRWRRLVYETGGLDAVSFVIEEDGYSMNISIVAAAGEIEALERVVVQPIVDSIQLP